MQTQLTELFKTTAEGREAEAILRSCVHCGFCTATCPTYRLLGDERDGPRGRIYLIKQVLEGKTPTERTQSHLDRCLSCRSCETTCPSGVRYGRLLEIGRLAVDKTVKRRLLDRLQRRLLRLVLAHPRRFAPLARLAKHLRPLVPARWQRRLPAIAEGGPWPQARHRRKMLVLDGCVQPSLAPAINAAAARVLDRLGIDLIRAEGAGCCGALSYHLSAVDEGLDFMRRNIDAWTPWLDGGAEAIVMTASGCGLMVKEYAAALQHDSAYADKASRVSDMTVDLAELLAREDLTALQPDNSVRVAFQSPCTLQHGQRLNGVVEAILQRLGFTLTPVADPHLCCGSAGSYSVLQPDLASRLRSNKLAALQAGEPDVIATANIGCLLHLAGVADKPIRHWIELVDREGTPVFPSPHEHPAS